MPNTIESPLAAIRNMAIDRLNWDARFVDSILDTLTDEQLMERAGDAGNHTLWIMGHIAQSTDFIIAMVSGESRVLDASWDERFGGGSTPSDERSDYPSRDELRDAMTRVRERTIAWIHALDESSMFAPVPEDLQPFAPDAASVPFTIVAHNLFHLGQVASIRSCLGMGPVHR